MESQIFQSVFLGFVQGITEFIPVSSSGHLAIMSYLFNLPEPSLSIDIALHLGTLGAVVVYFWRDWFNLFGLKKDMEVYQANKKLIWYLILASTPAAIFGLAFNDTFDKIDQNPIRISLMILTGSIFLFLTDRYSSKNKSLSELKMKEALTVGFFQVLALLPGVSRSGMTIGSARLLKVNRLDSARFSFLLGTPVIFGAGLVHLKHFGFENFNSALLISVTTSFVVGILTIHFFLTLIQKISYAFFFWYSVAMVLIVMSAVYIF